jgi:hypothetical protein
LFTAATGALAAAGDPGEGYYLTPEHPDPVRKILEGVERLLPGLPETVRNAWAETKARKTAPYQIGSPPRAAAM